MKKSYKAIAHLLLIVFIFAGCGAPPTPTETVEDMFECIKKLDFDKAKEYLLNEDVGVDKEQLDSLGTEGDIIESLLKNIEYEVISVDNAETNEAVIHTNVKTINVRELMSDFVPLVLRHTIDSLTVLGNGQNTDPGSLITADFNKLMADKKYSNYEKIVDIKAINVNGTWKIDLGQSLINFLYKDVNEMFNELEDELNRIQVNIND